MYNKALVTGGSRGIGSAIVSELKNKGFDVFAPTREQLDLSNLESVKSFIHKNSDNGYGVIVNNAGINEINLIEDVTDDEINQTMNINLLAPYLLLQGFVPRMKKKRYGRIVNIGSIWGKVSKSGRSVYSMTKHGIHGITKSLAVELAEYNILVNTICPGFTLTELTKKNNTEQEIKVISDGIPAKRMAEPQEIAKVVAFFVSEDNTYVTGQQILADGGYSSI